MCANKIIEMNEFCFIFAEKVWQHNMDPIPHFCFLPRPFTVLTDKRMFSDVVSVSVLLCCFLLLCSLLFETNQYQQTDINHSLLFAVIYFLIPCRWLTSTLTFTVTNAILPSFLIVVHSAAAYHLAWSCAQHEVDGRSAKLESRLSPDAILTLFAPSDRAFNQLPADLLDALQKDKTSLDSLLAYHTVEGLYSSATLTQDVTELPTTSTDNNVTFTKSGGAVAMPQGESFFTYMLDWSSNLPC